MQLSADLGIAEAETKNKRKLLFVTLLAGMLDPLLDG